MNGNGNGDTQAFKFANSVSLTIISRLGMIFASLALPIVGWMIQRGVSTVDDVGRKVDTLSVQSVETNGTVKMIQQTQAIQTQIIADHEARMRLLERVLPTPR